MGRCRPLSEDEAASMKAHCYNPEERALINFLEHTGYRARETSSLTVGDLWDGHQVKDRVQVKARNMKKKVIRRPIPIGAELKKVLVLWFAQLQQSGLLKADTPVWLSRKHVTKL